jgi:hypothetical protein
VRVNAEKQRAGDILLLAIQANRLGDGEDVPFIKSCAGTAESGTPV